MFVVITIEQEFQNTERNFWHFVMFNLASLSIAKKKVVTYNNSWPCSNSFVLIFVAVRRRALYLSSIQLCITFLYILCSKCDDQKSRDEPTSLSIASTISLLPPFSGIFCFKNTGGKLLFLLFLAVKALLLLALHYSPKLAKSLSQRVLDKRQQFEIPPCSISEHSSFSNFIS